MIPLMVDLLDNLVVIPIDSEQMELIFHHQGVNMRYLGEVALQASLHHVKEICRIEMIARTLKRILNTQMSRKILNLRNLIQSLSNEIKELE